jgi:hypothetical protein
MDGQDVGQRLRGKAPPGTSARHLGVHGSHCGPKLREVQAVERRDWDVCRVDVKRFVGDPIDQARL